MQASATPDHPESMFPHCSVHDHSITVHDHSKHIIMHEGLFTGRITSFTQVEDFANHTHHIRHLTVSNAGVHMYVHGHRGDFQRGTSAIAGTSV